MRGIDTFIVRVCPLGAGGLHEPIGTVEHVDARRYYTFRGASELMSLLLGKWAAAPEGGRSTRGKPSGDTDAG